MQQQAVAVSDFEALPAVDDGFGRFVVFDAARVPNAVHLLEAYGLKFCCLFSGKVAIELEDEAPYLIELDQLSPQSEEFIWSLLENGHGIAVYSPLNLTDLRRHLKKFLKTDTNGVEVYVKFYTAMNFQYIFSARKFLDPLFDKVQSVVLSKGDLSDQFSQIFGKAPRHGV